METLKILQYVLVLEVEIKASTPDESPSKTKLRGQARSLIVTTNYLCLVTEDIVSYPLPDFARGLPERPRFRIEDIHSIRSVQRVVCSDFMSHDVTIVLKDETINVDTQHQHFTMGVEPDTSKDYKNMIKEKTWKLVIQSPHDKSRLLKLIEQQLDVIDPGRKLSIQISA